MREGGREGAREECDLGDDEWGEHVAPQKKDEQKRGRRSRRRRSRSEVHKMKVEDGRGRRPLICDGIEKAVKAPHPSWCPLEKSREWHCCGVGKDGTGLPGYGDTLSDAL